MLGRKQIESRDVLFAAALVVLLLQLGAAAFEYVRHAHLALTFPFPLDYGEGPILDQVLRLAQFENIYRGDISTPPYTITSYPPLFQLLQVPFAKIIGPAFWYGRLISTLSVPLAALFIALTIETLTHDRIAASISGFTLFAFPYIAQGSILDRGDTLAQALSWAGLFAIVRWPDRRRGLVLSTICLTGAIYTKPAYGLVAPLTALIWLWQGKRRQQMIRLAGALCGNVLALFLLVDGVTFGGFHLNIVRGIVAGFSVQN